MRVGSPVSGLRSLAAGLSCLVLSGTADAQMAEVLGRRIAEVRILQEARPVDERVILGLIETEVGAPLSMRDVRQSIDHLYGLGRFDDIQVASSAAEGGVVVTFTLVPRHPVQSVEFTGALGLPEADLRQAMVERFGALPSAGRAADVARALVGLYRDRGYTAATVTPRVEEYHNPDRAEMTFAVESGPRATVERVAVDGLDAAARAELLSESELRRGEPYDSVAIARRLAEYENSLRARGFYEARATHTAEFTPGGGALVDIAVDRGPVVTIAYAGDPLPRDELDDLVPVRREGSADLDLLEDSARRIVDYLRERGYRDADAQYTREQDGDTLVITFTVRRGPRHVVERVAVRGNTAIATPVLLDLLRVETDEPFVQATLDAGINAVQQAYRAQGFTRADVKADVAALPGVPESPAERRVEVSLDLTEGPRTLVEAVVLDGNAVLAESTIRAVMSTVPGEPYSELRMVEDRDRIQLEYLNRGYESAVVEPGPGFSEDLTRATVTFAISEGPQVMVDHVIILGNERTSTETIQNALLLRPGEPLGYAARLESQQRLAALGLFRSVRITELRHGSEPRRDVLVQVEEAPPTTIGIGGGVEVDSRLRTGPDGRAEERLEAAPRGFFEIGRRNLWGKNRSITFFTRVSLRSRDEAVAGAPDAVDSSYGFNEYRVVGNFREPRAFDTPADLLVTGIVEQAIRSSFNFRRRQARAEMGLRVSERYGVAGRYSFERTELFDERFTDEDDPVLIDRLFPQVRLSKFSLSVLRDTRSDVLDPDRGTLLAADNDFAARSIGSEVGFARTYLQALTFFRLPTGRRVVVGLAGRVGLAHGFRREVERVDDNGNTVVDVVEDLPASERFFGGGDTTVRGFSLDRLGTEETISATGFPTGGNGLVVLNAELRVNVWRALDTVGFVDAGNVFPRVGDIDVTDLRGAIGFGIRYRSPVGPIRVDLGFKLDRRELVPGSLERRSVLHVSLGQAF